MQEGENLKKKNEALLDAVAQSIKQGGAGSKEVDQSMETIKGVLEAMAGKKAEKSRADLDEEIIRESFKDLGSNREDDRMELGEALEKLAVGSRGKEFANKGIQKGLRDMDEKISSRRSTPDIQSGALKEDGSNLSDIQAELNMAAANFRKQNGQNMEEDRGSLGGASQKSAQQQQANRNYFEESGRGEQETTRSNISRDKDIDTDSGISDTDSGISYEDSLSQHDGDSLSEFDDLSLNGELDSIDGAGLEDTNVNYMEDIDITYTQFKSTGTFLEHNKQEALDKSITQDAISHSKGNEKEPHGLKDIESKKSTFDRVSSMASSGKEMSEKETQMLIESALQLSAACGAEIGKVKSGIEHADKNKSENLIQKNMVAATFGGDGVATNAFKEGSKLLEESVIELKSGIPNVGEQSKPLDKVIPAEDQNAILVNRINDLMGNQSQESVYRVIEAANILHNLTAGNAEFVKSSVAARDMDIAVSGNSVLHKSAIEMQGKELGNKKEMDIIGFVNETVNKQREEIKNMQADMNRLKAKLSEEKNIINNKHVDPESKSEHIDKIKDIEKELRSSEMKMGAIYDNHSVTVEGAKVAIESYKKFYAVNEVKEDRLNFADEGIKNECDKEFEVKRDVWNKKIKEVLSFDTMFDMGVENLRSESVKVGNKMKDLDVELSSLNDSNKQKAEAEAAREAEAAKAEAAAREAEAAKAEAAAREAEAKRNPIRAMASKVFDTSSWRARLGIKSQEAKGMTNVEQLNASRGNSGQAASNGQSR